MGVLCEISINKTADEVFRPGMAVSGEIRYTVNKETTFSRITVSIKGTGRVVITEKRTDKDRTYDVTSSTSENYVDIDNIITKENEVTLPIGSYETQFGFQLPHNVPQSLRYTKYNAKGSVECKIKYYVGIKFDQPGCKCTKRFKKEFTVAPNVIPRLPMEPVIYEQQKTLAQIFSAKKRIVYIKTSTESCVIAPGGTIRFYCEINNDTNIDIKALKTKLIEVYSFYTTSRIQNQHFVHQEKVKFTNCKTTQIKRGRSETFDFKIDVPADLCSIENTTIVKRQYFIWVETVLPIPHRNVLQKIEVQIGNLVGEDINVDNSDFGIHNDAPPSYWEAMSEEKKDADMWTTN
ncbi:uncharacterized protein LOC126368326 [Pectinophora gossypiella]|uniref:uncharacterized protein LOC126368326 n=1 Tax=Pectinophora gossypiella TaxID=13191 RepID=UPI00214EE9EB|nr:uncharacterized protein LOC126368326 [Pectinophora gossypiella]